MLAARLKARIAGALDYRVGQSIKQINALERELDAASARSTEAEQALLQSITALESIVTGELHGTVRGVAAEEPRNRRALHELRSQPDYRNAFTEVKPLVSICITTSADRTQMLLQRAIPSALAQTYKNIEVVVVGDAVAAETGEAISRLGDPRVRFTNLTQRVVHPDPRRHWLTAATMPLNEAHRQARGLWITDLDDDDALRPDAVEALLELAQARELEVAYGMHEQHHPDAQSTVHGAFPPGPLEPDWRAKGMAWQPWQGAASTKSLFHAGLRIFAREHVAAELGIPGDFFRLERMVRAGVRFGMLERVCYDYYPSTLWNEIES